MSASLIHIPIYTPIAMEDNNVTQVNFVQKRKSVNINHIPFQFQWKTSKLSIHTHT